MQLLSKLKIVVPVAALACIADLYTKHWAIERLRGRLPITIVENFFHLRYVENRGMAWGIGQGLSTAVFIVLAGIAVSVLVYFIVVVPAKHKFTHAALGLIAGGALGNLIDRLRFGYVVDFIDWHYYQYHWPTFNLADAFITIGTAVLVLQMLFMKDDPFSERADNQSDLEQPSAEEGVAGEKDSSESE